MPERNPPILTPIQVKILLALLRSKDHSLNSEAVLRETGIALSTWSAEQGKLVDMGLIEKRLVRVLTSENISKRMSYTLSESGVAVALNLLNISKILSSSKNANSVSDNFGQRVSECVEIALDSFGPSSVQLVKTTLESSYGVSWSRLSEKPAELMRACRELFGEEASKKLETVIAANIARRFALQGTGSDLASAISKAKKSYSAEFSEESRQKLLGESKLKN